MCGWKGIPAIALILAPIVSCSPAGQAPLAASDQSPPARLQLIAGIYGQMRWTNEQVRFGPESCVGPTMRVYNREGMSASTDAATHGRKLYALYVRMPEAYQEHNMGDQPVGQEVVKQTWTPKRYEPRPDGLGPEVFDLDGSGWERGERRELFIMYKLDPSTPNTDRGWVYGVVAADDKTVLASGPIASCVACHEKAPRDRMLGLEMAK